MGIKRDDVWESILLKLGTELRTSFISAVFYHVQTNKKPGQLVSLPEEDTGAQGRHFSTLLPKTVPERS